jgi:hypothetical protein
MSLSAPPALQPRSDGSRVGLCFGLPQGPLRVRGPLLPGLQRTLPVFPSSPRTPREPFGRLRAGAEPAVHPTPLFSSHSRCLARLTATCSGAGAAPRRGRRIAGRIPIFQPASRWRQGNNQQQVVSRRMGFIAFHVLGTRSCLKRALSSSGTFEINGRRRPQDCRSRCVHRDGVIPKWQE